VQEAALPTEKQPGAQEATYPRAERTVPAPTIIYTHTDEAPAGDEDDSRFSRTQLVAVREFGG
jgi:hypothetical protein